VNPQNKFYRVNHQPSVKLFSQPLGFWYSEKAAFVFCWELPTSGLIYSTQPSQIDRHLRYLFT